MTNTAMRAFSAAVALRLLLLQMGVPAANGQDAGAWMRRADSLHRECRFTEALAAWDSALALRPDSLTAKTITSRRILSLNGENMLRYASTPVVVARERFSLADFYLFYPLPDKSWRKLPNVFDPVGKTAPVRATYVPEGVRELYFSAPGCEGEMNIYHTRLQDSLWTAPALAGEALLSPEHEIFPMLSPDGKTLYFSSIGLFGMGGYDLFRSDWDAERKEWGPPVNLGFPYSSPADDFLFVNTADGRYSLFASNRDCPADSVRIYVLEYDPTPVRKALDDPADIRKTFALAPVEDLSRMDNASTVTDTLSENADVRKYRDQMETVRLLRDSVAVINRHLDDLRSALAAADSSRKVQYRNWIVEVELAEAELESVLAKESKELSRIEMDFLVKGVILDPAALSVSADKEVVGAAASYTFTKNLYGPKVDVVMEKALRDSAGFQRLVEGNFASKEAPKDGLVYQIQILSCPLTEAMVAAVSAAAETPSPASRSRTGRNASKPATPWRPSVAALHGLAPVYERFHLAGENPRADYFVGVFRSYGAALSSLNTVRRAGFPDARIVARYQDAPIDLRTARRMEK